MTKVSLRSDCADIAGSADFRDLLPLPALRGLPLALTAVRALELWSDLAGGVAAPAKLKPSERIDVMDECLDVVVLEPQQPAGFVFAGMTVAELRAALKAAAGYSVECAQFEHALHGSAAHAMRDVARQRIACRPVPGYLCQRAFLVPEQAEHLTVDNLPLELHALQETAHPGYRTTRRNRLAVEILETTMLEVRRFPTRGKRLPLGQSSVFSPNYFVWDDQRLLPRDGKLKNVRYREYQLALPSLESSYFSDHFPVRNLFAHLRFTEYCDANDCVVVLLDEVESDWMRDLRPQRSGVELGARRLVGGVGRQPVMPRVPDLPVAAYWLDLAMKAFAEAALARGANIIAWVPGWIQSELNLKLPLSVARPLYDRQVPKLLAAHLQGANERRTEIDYPTYRRDVFIQYRKSRGWVLARQDHETIASGFVADRETILQLYRLQARSTVERLPAFRVDTSWRFDDDFVWPHLEQQHDPGPSTS